MAIIKRQNHPLRILHLFRSPVGGLFRHVCDLVQAQLDYGLCEGVVCDSMTGGEFADDKCARMEPLCSLGVYRLPMNRSVRISDLRVLNRISEICRSVKPDIIHGHGAKGGAYARLLAKRLSLTAIYTPHGGSLHYDTTSVSGIVYLGFERLMKKYTDGYVFESKYIANEYQRKIGSSSKPTSIIYNGLNEEEFMPVSCQKECKNFVFVGELRKLKGIEVLLKAMSRLTKLRDASLLVVGSGPDADFFSSLIRDLGLESSVTLMPPTFPATRSFSRAECVVVPSINESMPYIVLEAAAAQVPLLATTVGGIPEIFGPHADHLVPPDDPEALADAMLSALDNRENLQKVAQCIQKRVRSGFRVESMATETLKLYEQVLHAT